MNPTCVILAFASICLTSILIFFFGKMNYQEYYKEKFHFYHSFPYEMCSRSRMKITPYIQLVLALFVASCLFLEISLLSYISLPSHTLLVVVGGFTSFMLSTLFFVPLENIKVHMAVATLSIAGTWMNFIALCYFAKATPLYIKGGDTLFYLSLAFLIIEVAMIFHPKLKGWYKLTPNSETGEMERPKYCYFAILEWSTFIFHLIYLFLLFLFLFLLA